LALTSGVAVRNSGQIELDRLSEILNILPAFIYILRPDHTIEFSNRMFDRIFGSPQGRNCHEIFNQQPSPCVRCRARQVFESKKETAYEWKYKANQTYMIYHGHFVDVDGKQKILAAGIDISEEVSARKALQKVHEELEHRVKKRTTALLRSTEYLKQEIEERKQTEKALRASERKYSTLVESSLTGIYIKQDGKIVFANGRFCDIHGYSIDDIIGMESWRLVHPADREMVEKYSQQRLQGINSPLSYEAQGITKDRRVIWVVRSNTRIVYKGRPAILGNIVDITLRKQMEANLKKSGKELRILSTQLLKAQETERQRIALELHDTIAQGLVTIKFTLAQKLKQVGNGPPPTGISLESVIDMLQANITQVRRIMTELRPSLLDDLGIMATINWQCREFQNIYRHIRIEKNLTVSEEEIPDDLKIVIFRILQEAMNNSAKHSEADRIILSLRCQGATLHLSIEDNGQGFDYQTALSNMNVTNGLGLIGMRERTELSFGVFQLVSNPNAGTRVMASWQIA